jgi:phospholipid/cholesterol/gamma-HCH transport system permease protein
MNISCVPAWFGKRVFGLISEAGIQTILLLNIMKATGYLLKRRHLVVSQMVNVGVNSLPLISIISIFTGAVASWQAAYQFQGIISKGMSFSFLGAAVSAAILIELSPVLVGIVIAAGSALLSRLNSEQ